MYRIDDATAVAAQPVPESAGTEGYFSEGNPGNGQPATNIRASWLNMIQEELAGLLAAAGIARAKGSNNQVNASLQKMYAPVVGTVRNGRMVLNAASASGAYTADELVVESGLGGQTYRLANFNQTINLATVGAGGMDTGAAPASSFVALYAMFNPTTGAQALVAQLANVLRSQVYAGANAPAGYTASALVAVVPTNPSAQMPILSVLDREVYFLNVQALGSSTAQGSLTALSLASIIPINARRIYGNLSGFVNTAGANFALTVYGSSAGAGNAPLQGAPGATVATCANSFSLPITTPQTVHYTSSISTGSFTYNIGLVGYGF